MPQRPSPAIPPSILPRARDVSLSGGIGDGPAPRACSQTRGALGYKSIAPFGAGHCLWKTTPSAAISARAFSREGKVPDPFCLSSLVRSQCNKRRRPGIARSSPSGAFVRSPGRSESASKPGVSVGQTGRRRSATGRAPNRNRRRKGWTLTAKRLEVPPRHFGILVRLLRQWTKFLPFSSAPLSGYDIFSWFAQCELKRGHSTFPLSTVGSWLSADLRLFQRTAAQRGREK